MTYGFDSSWSFLVLNLARERRLKFIFLSQWIKNQFIKDTDINDNPSLIVFYPGIKTIGKFPIKKKTVLFVGKLNSDKGYDIYLNAINIFLKKFPEWTSISAGTENRRTIPANNNRYGCAVASSGRSSEVCGFCPKTKPPNLDG